MVGDLAATVRLHYRDSPRIEDVLSPSSQSLRVDARMLTKPELVAGLGCALCSELLHRFVGRQVIDLTQVNWGQTPINFRCHCSWFQSTTLIMGCVESVR